MAESTFNVAGTEKPLTRLIDFDGGRQPIFIGEATPGTLSSAAKWRIQKRAYTDNKLISIKWAEGNGNFVHIYNNRGTFTYT